MLNITDLKQILGELENIAMNHIIEGIELDDDVITIHTDDIDPVEIDLFPGHEPQTTDNVCPICGCEESTGDGVEIDGVWAKQECTCGACEAVFVNWHRLERQELVSYKGESL